VTPEWNRYSCCFTMRYKLIIFVASFSVLVNFLWIIRIVECNEFHDTGKVKWFAYCHFDAAKDSFLIESLKCDKCYTFYNELNEKIQIIYDEFEIDAHGLKKKRKKRNAFYVNNINDNYCSYYESNSKFNKHFHWIITNESNEQEEIPLIPYLNEDWLSNELAYLIDKKEVLTNLDDFHSFVSELDKNLKSIELDNFGIESIHKNAFSKFSNLKKLKLSYNNFHDLDLSSLLTSLNYEDTATGGGVGGGGKISTIEDLDLSYNKLSNIKLENSIYLTNLNILNMSNNLLRNFDLNFIKVIMPNLKTIDLSFNSVKRFQLLDNRVYSIIGQESFKKIPLSDFLSNVQNVNKKATVSFELESELNLKKLSYLNLNGNNLFNFVDLISLNSVFLNDTRFCDLNNNKTSKK
jgi:hypothetical protein